MSRPGLPFGRSRTVVSRKATADRRRDWPGGRAGASAPAWRPGKRVADAEVGRGKGGLKCLADVVDAEARRRLAAWIGKPARCEAESYQVEKSD
jgi:hypothetical protein